jgi:hypothetical protein
MVRRLWEAMGANRRQRILDAVVEDGGFVEVGTAVGTISSF